LGINARQLSQRESQGDWYTVGAGSPGPVAAGRIPHKTSSVALTAMAPSGRGLSPKVTGGDRMIPYPKGRGKNAIK